MKNALTRRALLIGAAAVPMSAACQPASAAGTGQSIRITNIGGVFAIEGPAGRVDVPADHVLGIARDGVVRVAPPNQRFARGSLKISADPEQGLRAIIGTLTMQEYLYGRV